MVNGLMGVWFSICGLDTLFTAKWWVGDGVTLGCFVGVTVVSSDCKTKFVRFGHWST